VSLRRTLLLASLVALGAVLALMVRAPLRRRRPPALSGHRVFAIRPGAVRGLEVAIEGRRFVGRRTEHGWEIDGRPATAGVADALAGLVDTLVALRAVDVFRPRDAASYGLDRPRGTVAVLTARGARHLVLGGFNSAASALYARREGDPRVLQVGTLLLSEVERVFYQRDGPAPTKGASAYRPEIG